MKITASVKVAVVLGEVAPDTTVVREEVVHFDGDNPGFVAQAVRAAMGDAVKKVERHFPL